ncbi:tRNA (adenine(22)-N(1))-methyltransferase [Salinithrix halophila]|uniref:tRNA (Adenine(22)-N(1))-methyltransferase n=1 Tax=Salinithrix halophila TaxID=1485204 RepID=A0ABV8JD72_9BACL
MAFEKERKKVMDQRAASTPEGDGHKIELSRRLAAVARFVPQGRVVADIGADHALLLAFLAQEGRIQKGIAGEVNLGPFENARDRVKDGSLDETIDVRQGDGLAVLAPREADVVVIAGMGGALIASILARGEEKLRDTERLILQPNNGAERVRAWLLERGWRVVAEDLVEDGGLLYEILVAEPGDAYAPYYDSGLPLQQALETGPLLWKERHPLFPEKIRKELEGRERILTSLDAGRTREALLRKQQLQEEISGWRRLLTWLSKETN